jgi:hypothetical protein
MSEARGASQGCPGRQRTRGWTHEWDSRTGPTHEWDSRRDPGSRTDGSLVAMEVASGRAGEGANRAGEGAS